MTIDEARKLIDELWDDQGYCHSCGWHALPYEHAISDSDIQDTLDGDGVLWLACISKDSDDSYSHRGVSIYLLPESKGGSDSG